MTRLLIIALALSAFCVGAVASAGAAEVSATGYGALLPEGVQGAATASAGRPDRTGSVAGLRPSGGGSIASITTTLRVNDAGVDGRAEGTVVVRGLSLFDGRVSIGAISMSARVEVGAGGRTVSVPTLSVEGLTVNGGAVAAGAGSRIAVPGIGTLVFFERTDTATGVRLNGMRAEITDPAASGVIGQPFVIGHLDLSAVAGEPPAGPPPAAPSSAPATTPASPAPPRRTTTAPRPATAPRSTPAPRPPVRRAPSRTSPLTVPEPAPLAPLPRQTPPRVTLAPPGDGYIFPVFGEVGFTNDYLAPRAGTGRHYGNDLFATTGTPVVAVADGTLSKVGVNTLGGNRLWLTDQRGNWFYYAHLSAFAPAAVDGARVTRGQVIGFVGNTGQAITTPPHLHFEIRPGGIESASINPYPHLIAWQRGADEVPRAFREGGEPAAPVPALGAVVVDAVPERDVPPGPGDGIARAGY